MKKQINLNLKYIWFAVNLLLLALPVFIPSSREVDSLINICFVGLVLLSFPCNILPNYLFFILGWFNSGTIGSLYSMMIILSIVSYFQWFVLVPYLARLARQKIAKADLQVSFCANIESIKNLPDAESSSPDWQKNLYDEQKRTPVERLFETDDQ